MSKALSEMQHGCRGLLPSRTVGNDDEEGVPCSSKEAQQLRWRRHFFKVLNLSSQFEEEVMETVRQKEVNGSIAGKPTEREVTRAVGKLKNGNAAGYTTSCWGCSRLVLEMRISRACSQN